MSVSLKTAPPMFPQTSLEQLKGTKPQGIEAEKARLRKATKEFDAFFMYYMMKNMRKTVPESTLSQETVFSGSMGKDMFSDLFDMEVSRRVAGGNARSIAELLYNSLEKQIDARYSRDGGDGPAKSIGIGEGEPIQFNQDNAPKPVPGQNFIDRPEVIESLPVSQSRPRVDQDPILARFGSYIHQAAAETKLDSALITSVIWAESKGNPLAVSRAGAKGLMQLMDSTAQEMGVREVFDPQANIRGGSRYLSKLLDKYGDVTLALAAYNAGPSTVDRYGGVPPFRETRDYITRVTDRLASHGTRFGGSHTKVPAD